MVLILDRPSPAPVPHYRPVDGPHMHSPGSDPRPSRPSPCPASAPKWSVPFTRTHPVLILSQAPVTHQHLDGPLTHAPGSDPRPRPCHASTPGWPNRVPPVAPAARRICPAYIVWTGIDFDWVISQIIVWTGIYFDWVISQINVLHKLWVWPGPVLVWMDQVAR